MPSPLKILFAALLLVGSASAAEPLPKPTHHYERHIEGWSVRVDRRLLGDDAETGARALQLLGARLLAIELVVPEPALARLRQVAIQLDLTHGELKLMQYHPSAAWLRAHGYDESLARCVHISNTARFLSPFENHRQPWAVLHDLAHAYHDQVLGFEEPRIKAAWERFRDSKKYDETLEIGGRARWHYGLTNQKEFFAEMTECYFGTNDFYPFNSGELRQVEPEIIALMEEIWGALPRQGQ